MDIREYLRFYSELGVSHLSIRRVSEPERSLESHGPGPAPTGNAQATDRLPEIQAEMGDCRRCKLWTTRHSIVFGSGNPHAELMFVGEAPGADEDAQGLPFVGKAGQLLTKIIEAIELRREQVFIANVLKCRPPGNRDPEPDEVEACESFLFSQIDTVNPLIIVALGKHAAQTLLKTETPISRLRGKFFDYRSRLLIPTFHPSYLLRNPQAKREVWDDMKAVRARLKDLGASYYN
jgi:DNA polymerase